ncbi:Dam family site-specific DNA-(adenine-N6)-methyltransferase [Candidatus Palauibacter sp.]|uniref:Dam family site-specific DNA-(adenine-N6)-methyltransferase n=1 Tax=Candidatus Palauibacter sp. TaxID=3101350 RepID=UPI003C6FB42B
MTSQPPQTYLRWIGGKQRLAPRLRHFVPRDYLSRTYHEPFLGAASLFLALRPRLAHLSDLNDTLIQSFTFVRARPDLVARYITQHAARDSKAYYYEIRDQYNRATCFSYAQAARFIYLNRTCYNGVFRVNREGYFNPDPALADSRAA